MHKGRHDKRAILVISDGMDAQNRPATLEALLGTIRRSEVLVYGLGTSQTVYADPNEHVPFTLPTPVSATRAPTGSYQLARPERFVAEETSSAASTWRC